VSGLSSYSGGCRGLLADTSPPPIASRAICSLRAPKADGEKKKKNKKRVETYSSYIYKVLKQVRVVLLFLLLRVGRP
jgi:hypothetical protein